MTLSSCYITKEIAVFSRIATALICLAIIPHKYCYAIVQQKETPTETIIYLQKNDFFRDCTRDTKVLINTEKDVVVYKDGQRHAYYTNEELCADQ